MPKTSSPLPPHTPDRSGDPPNPAAEDVLARISQQQIHCALYKNCSTVEAALAGAGDFDLLVKETHLPKLRSLLEKAGGIRGYASRLYDNAIPEREDWFVPAAGTKLLHFDLAHAVMAGPKFHKRYRAFEFTDLLSDQLENTLCAGLMRVTPETEARIALVRTACGMFPVPRGRGLRARGELRRLLNDVVPPHRSDHAFLVDIGDRQVACRVRRMGSRLLVDRRGLRAIRQAVRRHNGVGRFAAMGHICVHALRRAAFAIWRRITRHRPGRDAARRRLNRGCIVALVGPDGAGKSTQAKRMTEIFGRKFRCTSVYLGSNDGSWMKIRGQLGLMRSARKVPRSPKDSAATGSGSGKEARGALYSLGSAIWRLVVAINRFLGVRRAKRLATSGTIVITDRWPQNIEEGILDGPSVAPARRLQLARLVWRLEKRLYRKLAAYRPTYTIHLDCDYASSHARKPGDIEPGDFARRIALMETMRERDPTIAVVDARQDADTVTARLFALIWQQLRRMA